MPPEERDPATLWQMIEMARHAILSLERLSQSDFAANIDARDAAVYRIQVIGEAANRISSALMSKHPEVPWRAIVDQRNVLVHGCDRINYEKVWSVVRNNLPELVDQLEGILKELDPGII